MALVAGKNRVPKACDREDGFTQFGHNKILDANLEFETFLKESR
jgi:hypothetical protein